MLVHSILKELEPYDNITIRNDAKIDNVLLEKDGLTYSKVQLTSGEDFTAELLVNMTYFTLFPLFINLSIYVTIHSFFLHSFLSI